MKADIEKLVAYCQSKDADPIGFGNVYRRSVPHSNLTRSKWHTMYKDAKVNVAVDFKLIRTGLVD
ncbi:Ger(x)C family spore germination C-terminal domain-containing protein [Bacillus sp. MUM 116]|uniref:Ger(x)C family spore germination C-terminal domain-containing protein n=1 Tax=Bacillus sp. MUM 116 TaxID=1678002 RepID=UPI0009F34C00